MNFKKKTQEFVYPQTIEINNTRYFIEVLFIKKKNSSVSIKQNTLVFRLAESLSVKKAQEHFSYLLKKIHKKIEKTPPQTILTIEDIMERGYFDFANQRYNLEYTTKTRSVKLIEQTFYMHPKGKPQNIEKYIIKFLSQRYEDRVKKYVKAKNKETYNFKIKDIIIKNVSSKWGHCTHDNVIMLNIKLLNAPIEVFDYVIIHELAHIKHKNHSNKYWLEVQKFCPNYKKLRKSLKDNPPKLYS
jgi:hypothetical protein